MNDENATNLGPITYLSPADLNPSTQNARTHSVEQIKQIAASITQFGFLNPILVTATGEIIAGHGRRAAALLLGLSTVPTVAIENLSPVQIRAYRLADNRLAELAEWDHALLNEEIAHLTEDGFDITKIGFDDTFLTGGDEADETVMNREMTYRVIIDCATEEEQRDLVTRLTNEGLNVKMIVS